MASIYWTAVFLLCWMVMVSVAGRRQLTKNPNHTKEQKRGKATTSDFWCPTCQGPTKESCDGSLTNTTCPKATFCLTVWDENMFARKCVNRKMLDLLTENCVNVSPTARKCGRRNKPYHLSWCEQSGCRAKEPGAVNKPESDPFLCPTCQSSSRESCDSTLAQTTCPKADLCMTLQDENVFVRKCVNRKMRNLLTKDCTRAGRSEEWVCRKKRRFHVSFCNQSGCKAEFSKVTKDRYHEEEEKVTKPFWCPTCQSTSEESCAATLTNTTCPKADFCLALWDEKVFTRKCINKKMLGVLTKNCRRGSSMEWECNRKRNYHVTVCNQPGCTAKVTEISTENEIPEDSSFRCPTCPLGKNSQRCDNEMMMTECPMATRCVVLRVNGTVDVENVFTRSCVNEKIFKMINRGCKNRHGCEIASCTQSGCKPML